MKKPFKSFAPARKPAQAKTRRFAAGKKIVNKIVQDATADEIDFPDLADDEGITVGATAEIDGNPATGEYVMPDGRVFVFKAGTLTKIIPYVEAAAMYQGMRKRKGKKVAFVSHCASTPSRTAGLRAYLDSKKPKGNPTATPDNRFAGMADRAREATKKKRIEDFKCKNNK